MLKPRYLALSALALIAAAGCASDPYNDPYYGSRYNNDPRYGTYSRPAYSDVAYNDYGRVVAIDAVRGSGHTSGGGAVAGAIIGGVLGHQVGSGRGNDVATAAGAVGGAVAGNEIEKRRNDDEGYRIVVQLRDGREATFMQESPNGLRVGDRVRIVDGRVYRD
jgi:outer membrane lipoprotein SlyB